MIVLDVLSKDQWANHSEKAHSIAFGGDPRPSSFDRVDFALVARNEKTLLGYITCMELDAKTLYWQLGGAFPSSAKTSLCFQMFHLATKWSTSKYQRVMVRVYNDNLPMLKLLLKVGFLVVGVRSEKRGALLELMLEAA